MVLVSFDMVPPCVMHCQGRQTRQVSEGIERRVGTADTDTLERAGTVSEKAAVRGVNGQIAVVHCAGPLHGGEFVVNLEQRDGLDLDPIRLLLELLNELQRVALGSGTDRPFGFIAAPLSLLVLDPASRLPSQVAIAIS